MALASTTLAECETTLTAIRHRFVPDAGGIQLRCAIKALELSSIRRSHRFGARACFCTVTTGVGA